MPKFQITLAPDPAATDFHFHMRSFKRCATHCFNLGHLDKQLHSSPVKSFDSCRAQPQSFRSDLLRFAPDCLKQENPNQLLTMLNKFELIRRDSFMGSPWRHSGIAAF